MKSLRHTVSLHILVAAVGLWIPFQSFAATKTESSWADVSEKLTYFQTQKSLADKGDAEAQYNLGGVYASGVAVKRDYRQAVYWLRRSAEQGFVEAQLTLGSHYYNGAGVVPDLEQAYFWYTLAIAQGNQLAMMIRDGIGLTPGQSAAALARAREWVAKPEQSDRSAHSSIRTPEATPPTARARPKSTGSGFAVSRTDIVTNAHVVKDCAAVRIGGQGSVKVVSIDGRNDLALLLAASPLAVAASLRSGRLRQGEAVTVIGYPLRGLLANGAQVTTGNVSALAGLENDTRFIQISAPVQPGNSGGPLLDSTGNVIGVVVGKLDAVKMAQATGDIPQNVNFAVSLLTLQGFLDANSVDYQMGPRSKNLSTADIAAIGKKFSVLVECHASLQ